MEEKYAPEKALIEEVYYVTKEGKEVVWALLPRRSLDPFHKIKCYLEYGDGIVLTTEYITSVGIRVKK